MYIFDFSKITDVSICFHEECTPPSSHSLSSSIFAESFRSWLIICPTTLISNYLLWLQHPWSMSIKLYRLLKVPESSCPLLFLSSKLFGTPKVLSPKNIPLLKLFQLHLLLQLSAPTLYINFWIHPTIISFLFKSLWPIWKYLLPRTYLFLLPRKQPFHPRLVPHLGYVPIPIHPWGFGFGSNHFLL